MQQESATLIEVQDEEMPACKTQLKSTARSIPQEVLLIMLNISGVGETLSLQKLTPKKFPMKFSCGYANTVLDGETGELREYWHVIQRPKYKENWGISFGNEIRRLGQGTEGRSMGMNTIFLSISMKYQTIDSMI